MFKWQNEPEFSSANRAQRARVDDYELLAFDIPADHLDPAIIGWEVFGPPRRQNLS